jgi:hypothetical protein
MGALGRISKKMHKHTAKIDSLRMGSTPKDPPRRKELFMPAGYQPGELNIVPTPGMRSNRMSMSVGDHARHGSQIVLVDMEIARHDLDERMAGYDAEIIYVDELEQVVPPHGQKYPKHALARKGSIFQGICNRTACDNVDARFYNKGTFGYYCTSCGWAINGRKTGDERLCIEVDHNLTHDEMNQLYRGHTFA